MDFELEIRAARSSPFPFLADLTHMDIPDGAGAFVMFRSKRLGVRGGSEYRFAVIATSGLCVFDRSATVMVARPAKQSIETCDQRDARSDAFFRK